MNCLLYGCHYVGCHSKKSIIWGRVWYCSRRERFYPFVVFKEKKRTNFPSIKDWFAYRKMGINYKQPPPYNDTSGEMVLLSKWESHYGK